MEHKLRPGQCTGRKTTVLLFFYTYFFLNGHLKRLNMNRLVAWPLLADIRTPFFSPLAGIFLLAPTFFFLGFAAKRIWKCDERNGRWDKTQGRSNDYHKKVLAST